MSHNPKLRFKAIFKDESWVVLDTLHDLYVDHDGNPATTGAGIYAWSTEMAADIIAARLNGRPE